MKPRVSPSPWLAVAAFILAASSVNPAHAQAVANAMISGVVTDPSGAAIPDAKVTATQTDTNAVRTTQSSSDGAFTLPGLAIGPYKLQAEAKGFTTYEQTGIILQVGESPKINIALKLGETTERVVVSSNGAMIQTDTTSVSQVIDHARMVDLPLNGRNATQLIMLSGAANDIGPANGMSDLTGSKDYFSADAISVAGGQANGTLYLLDGGENMDSLQNVNLPLPFPDALQEFSVETSALSARYGMHPGAVVNTVTRSGTNEFHGNLFEFVRNGDANAIDYFATQQDSLKRNQFGGTLGAPILKNRLFGFFGYQRTNIRTAPPSTFSYVATAAALNGDFSQLEGPGCQSSGASRTLIDPSTGQPFPGNQVPTSRFNQQALNLLKLIPVASDPCGKIVYSLPEPQSENQFVGRGDWIINSKNSLFGHIFKADYQSPGPFSESNILLTQLRGVIDHSISAVFGETYTLSPNIVNSAHAGYTRLTIARGPSPNAISLAKLGVDIPYQPASNYMRVGVGGHFTVGCGTCAPVNIFQNNTQLADDMDISLGRHHLSVGGEWVNHWQKSFGLTNAEGIFNFSGQSTNDALVDFMLGVPNSFVQGNKQEFDGRQNYFGVYAHDVVRLSKALTAQVGLRWEPNLWGHEIYQKQNHFSQAAFTAGTTSNVFINAPPGLQFPGDPGVPRSFSTNDYWKFQPRAGIAWDPTGSGRQVIRVGYGLFYDLMALGYWNDQTGDAPWGSSITLASPTGGFSTPYAGYPGGSPFPAPQPPSKTVSFPSHGTYITFPLHGHQTYTHQWNLTYEFQPLKDWVFSVGYLGNITVHVWGGRDVNAGVYIPGTCGDGPCSTTSNTDRRRVLYLQDPVSGSAYSDIFQADDSGVARYQALLVKGEHRFTHNFTILANYAYSHCISDVDFIGDIGGSQTQNPDSLKGEHGNCGFDIRHGINVSAVMESPRLNNHLADKLVGTWKLAPILTARSGTWFTPYTGVDNSLTSIGLDRPNVAGYPYVRDLKTLQWVTPAGFVPNPIGTFGNAGNQSLEGPGAVNLDTALSREFIVRERMRLELRFEAFNVLNHPNFSNPDNLLSDSTFGQIQSDAGPRILQFAGRLQF
jgi:Carboxypeptidase regulatory-like domain